MHIKISHQSLNVRIYVTMWKSIIVANTYLKFSLELMPEKSCDCIKKSTIVVTHIKNLAGMHRIWMCLKWEHLHSWCVRVTCYRSCDHVKKSMLVANHHKKSHRSSCLRNHMTAEKSMLVVRHLKNFAGDTQNMNESKLNLDL